MAAIHATTENFEKIASTNEIVVVDFWATWCGPCRSFGPIFEKVSEKYPEIPFVKVDIDKSNEIAAAAQIQAVPTVMVIKRGEVIYDKLEHYQLLIWKIWLNKLNLTNLMILNPDLQTMP